MVIDTKFELAGIIIIIILNWIDRLSDSYVQGSSPSYAYITITSIAK